LAGGARTFREVDDYLHWLVVGDAPSGPPRVPDAHLFLRWVDETPRGEMIRELLAEVSAVVEGRGG
jgi:hypothetical protein